MPETLSIENLLQFLSPETLAEVASDIVNTDDDSRFQFSTLVLEFVLSHYLTDDERVTFHKHRARSGALPIEAPGR